MKRATRSQRFPVAMHLMSLLALVNLREGDVFLSSGRMARSVDKNEVALRIILGSLVEANLIETAVGAKGGARLARPAREITCLDIYKAVEERALFSVHDGNPECLVSTCVSDLMTHMFEEAERRFDRELATVCLADVVENINTTAIAEGFEPLPIHEPAPPRDEEVNAQ